MPRRQCKKFIPDGDRDFAEMARHFARNIAKDPARFQLSEKDSGTIQMAVAKFRKALCVSLAKATRTQLTRMSKDDARAKLERIIRKYGNVIRVNDAIGSIDKTSIRVRERPTRLQHRECPSDPPLMIFSGSGKETAHGAATHIIRFNTGLGTGTRAKPAGASRLELFVELVGPNEPIPNHPGELSGGRPWYLRSFTRSPAEVEYPMPTMPMLIVYWGRWADATGRVSKWSKTLIARVEGWPTETAAFLTHNPARRIDSNQITSVRTLDGRTVERYQGEYLLSDESENHRGISRALPDQTARRQLTVMVNQA